MIGQRFNFLTVIELLGRKGSEDYWLCLCDCGKQRKVTNHELKYRAKSCGCKTKPRLTHGLTGTKEHNIWVNIKQRCLNPNVPAYKNYGGRGITICDRWLNSFENFLEDIGLSPTPQHSIDRIDNNKGYEPSNCRWATDSEQMKNRRYFRNNGKLISYSNELLTIRELAKKYGLKPATLYKRLDNNWTIEEAVSTPANPKFATKT